ncbi:MAG: hypothetical protein AB7H97_01825 [Pseudobdellovibrionaceae bacterium]
MKCRNLGLRNFTGGMITALLSLALAGCSAAKFEATKKDTLGKSNVFGPDSATIVGNGSDSGASEGAGTSPTGSLVIDGSSSAGSDSGLENESHGSGGYGNDGGGSFVDLFGGRPNSGNGQDGGKSDLIMQGNIKKVPVSFVCSNELSVSDYQSETDGSIVNLRTSSAIKVTVKNENNAIVCTKSAGVKEALLSSKTLDLESCALPMDTYVIEIADVATGKNLISENATINAYALSSDELLLNHSARPRVIADVNHTLVEADGNGNSIAPDLSINCDSNASPLVINFTEPEQEDLGLMLSDPNFGVLFDILGLNSFPFAHAKKKISWPQNSDYMFLGVLNKHGRIGGIDQLFGDNTYGPDRKFAANGFAALAKYDDNKDSFIDAQDSIFSKLVVWSDQDQNAVSGQAEIRSLESMDVTRLDLSYDPDFYESDIHGNEAKYKSVVIMNNGSHRVVFDLWFTLKAN